MRRKARSAVGGPSLHLVKACSKPGAGLVARSLAVHKQGHLANARHLLTLTMEAAMPTVIAAAALAAARMYSRARSAEFKLVNVWGWICLATGIGLGIFGWLHQ